MTGFTEACYDQNSIESIKIALQNSADETDLKTWSINEDQYFDSLMTAGMQIIIDECEGRCNDAIICINDRLGINLFYNTRARNIYLELN